MIYVNTNVIPKLYNTYSASRRMEAVTKEKRPFDKKAWRHKKYDKKVGVYKVHYNLIFFPEISIPFPHLIFFPTASI